MSQYCLVGGASGGNDLAVLDVRLELGLKATVAQDVLGGLGKDACAGRKSEEEAGNSWRHALGEVGARNAGDRGVGIRSMCRLPHVVGDGGGRYNPVGGPALCLAPCRKSRVSE